MLSVVPDGVPEVRYKRFPELSDAKADKIDITLGEAGSRRPADSRARLGAVRRPWSIRRTTRTRSDRSARSACWSSGWTTSRRLARTPWRSSDPADGKPVNLVLPQALLDAVRRDAARWRPAR